MGSLAINHKVEKENIFGKVFSAYMTVIAIVLVTACTNTYDYSEFRASYNGLIKTSFEPGYVFFERLFFNYGISFDVFKLIVLGISMFMIHKTVKEYIDNGIIWRYYLAFMIFPLYFYAYSIRNAIAVSIVIYAFRYLLENSKRGYIKYILAVLISASFHVSSIIFLVFIVIPILASTNNKKLLLRLFIAFIIFFSIVITASSTLLQSFMDFIWSIIFLILDIPDYKKSYFQIVGRWGFLLSVITHVSSFILLYTCKNYLERTKNNTKTKSEYNMMYRSKVSKLMNYVYYSNILLTIVIPIIRVNGEFTRIYKSITPLYYISAISVIGLLRSEKRRYMLINLLLITTVIINFAVYVWPYRTITFYTLFTDNWIANTIFK